MAEQDLKHLRSRRGLYKSTITRLDNFITDPLNLASATIDTLQARRDKLMSTLKEYEGVHLDILSLDSADKEDIGVIEDKYFDVLGKLNAAIKEREIKKYVSELTTVRDCVPTCSEKEWWGARTFCCESDECNGAYASQPLKVFAFIAVLLTAAAAH